MMITRWLVAITIDLIEQVVLRIEGCAGVRIIGEVPAPKGVCELPFSTTNDHNALCLFVRVSLLCRFVVISCG